MDDVREDILWLRRQWNPATADDELIASYGASRGILRTKYDTDESYRLRVVNAYAWHKVRRQGAGPGAYFGGKRLCGRGHRAGERRAPP